MADLIQQTTEFCTRISNVLNSTIASNVQINAKFERNNSQAVVGNRIKSADLTEELVQLLDVQLEPDSISAGGSHRSETDIRSTSRASSEPFGLSTDRKSARLYMELFCGLEMDFANEYLMVTASTIALYADRDGAEPLVRFDFERNKSTYPDAHIQIFASSDSWERALSNSGRSKDPLHKLHFPVGGRRFRPTLEDVIEFLIVEEMVGSKNGWSEVLKTSREDFYRLQLAAAVRRHPQVALDALLECGCVTSAALTANHIHTIDR